MPPAALVLACTVCLGGEGNRAPIDPWLLARVADKQQVEYLVVLKQRAPTSRWSGIASRAQRLRAAGRVLRETARRSQGPLLRLLDTRNVSFRPFWVANAIWVRSSPKLMFELAIRPEVGSIDSNPRVRLPEPARARGAHPPKAATWNLNLVGAPEVWDLGITGEGVVIGGQDTGYQWNHAALIASYRGWDGETVDHNYNWHDAIHEDNEFCSGDSSFPCDDDVHGSHTMGTMVGDDGGANQIGVAPGARWIGCRNMNRGFGTPASYMECFQWFLAPTDLNGENPDAGMAPHVINNSWSCPPFEGCTNPDALLQTVENVRAAGILVVVSAGNEGPGCESVANPPAIYDASFTVGATDELDFIASFSSRGPVTVDDSQRLKPDITAPGVGILSSVPGGYAVFSGTSMSGPHVAGLVALLISADRSLAGRVTEIEALVTRTALPRTTTQDCGAVPGSSVPNNTFGYGRIDIPAAVSIALERVFRDGFETL